MMKQRKQAKHIKRLATYLTYILNHSDIKTLVYIAMKLFKKANCEITEIIAEEDGKVNKTRQFKERE